MSRYTDELLDQIDDCTDYYANARSEAGADGATARQTLLLLELDGQGQEFPHSIIQAAGNEARRLIAEGIANDQVAR